MGQIASCCKDCFRYNRKRSEDSLYSYVSGDDEGAPTLVEDNSWKTWSSARGTHLSADHTYKPPVYQQHAAEAVWEL